MSIEFINMQIQYENMAIYLFLVADFEKVEA
jgi:hypothetical protein